LSQVAKDDPVNACAVHTLDPNSLDNTGWKKYKYKNGNHLWGEAVYPDMLTSRSVTPTRQWINQMLVDWYCKKQDTVQSATYGSESVAASRIILTDQTISSMAITPRRYHDVPVKAPPRTFGANKESDVNTMGNHVPSHVKMHKQRNMILLQQHIMLPFHRVREAIGTKLMTLNFTPGDNNLDDVLSKTWNDTQVWLTLKPGLFLGRRHDGLLCSDDGPDSLRQMGSDKLRCVRRVTNSVPSSSIRRSLMNRASMDTARVL
jgi:hypothetical protein